LGKFAEISKFIAKSFAVSQKLRIFADAFRKVATLCRHGQSLPRCESCKFLCGKGIGTCTRNI